MHVSVISFPHTILQKFVAPLCIQPSTSLSKFADAYIHHLPPAISAALLSQKKSYDHMRANLHIFVHLVTDQLRREENVLPEPRARLLRVDEAVPERYYIGPVDP